MLHSRDDEELPKILVEGKLLTSGQNCTREVLGLHEAGLVLSRLHSSGENCSGILGGCLRRVSYVAKGLNKAVGWV